MERLFLEKGGDPEDLHRLADKRDLSPLADFLRPRINAAIGGLDVDEETERLDATSFSLLPGIGGALLPERLLLDVGSESLGWAFEDIADVSPTDRVVLAFGTLMHLEEMQASDARIDGPVFARRLKVLPESKLLGAVHMGDVLASGDPALACMPAESSVFFPGTRFLWGGLHWMPALRRTDSEWSKKLVVIGSVPMGKDDLIAMGEPV